MASGTDTSQGERFGESLLTAVKRLVLATRPLFFPASVLPVVLGTAWGARLGGALDLGAFCVALGAIVCVHAGANVVNDVYDDLGGTDRINTGHIHPYTGGSRSIQNGIMTARQMFRWGVALLVVSAVLGTALFAMKGLGVLLFGLAGLALGVLYSVPPARLGARGLGEWAVGLGFGVLPVTGAAWLQSGVLDWGALVLSLPAGLWVANILLVNEVPDAAADAATGKRTLVVRLGLEGAAALTLLLNALAVLCVVAATVASLLSPAAMVVPLLAFPVARLAARDLTATRNRRHVLLRAIKATLAIHAVGTLWLAGWAWIG